MFSAKVPERGSGRGLGTTIVDSLDSLLILHPTTDHIKPAAISRISTTRCRDELNLPVRSSQMDWSFQQQHCDSVVNKLSFTSRSVVYRVDRSMLNDPPSRVTKRRFTFKILRLRHWYKGENGSRYYPQPAFNALDRR